MLGTKKRSSKRAPFHQLIGNVFMPDYGCLRTEDLGVVGVIRIANAVAIVILSGQHANVRVSIPFQVGNNLRIRNLTVRMTGIFGRT